MKRRSFLHTGTWSLMSLGLPASIFSIAWKQQSDVYHWLSQLTAAVGARRRTALWGQPEGLQKQIQQTNAFLAGRGFISQDSGLFFYPGQPDYCFYPLVLRHAASDLTDLLVPVLGRRPDGSWQQLVVLTGYQIEALARAAANLDGQKAPLCEVLLPVGPVMESGGTFPTARGSVRIGTRLHRGFATTELLVRAGEEVVFTENFASEHCLSSTPLMVAA